MSDAKLPDRASLEYLKKLAKKRVKQLRIDDPQAKLTTAQLAIAREHGFSSWRSLKTELESRQASNVTRFFDACENGDVQSLSGLLVIDPNLVRASNPKSRHGGWTGLHSAAQRGHIDVAQLLLKNGANVNAREAGDNTYALHWAVASGHADTVRALLDSGGDVHGNGDVHELDVIGWATVFRPSGDISRDILSLLLEGGARHHIFSAIAVGDPELIRDVVEQNPKTLDRRMSRFEHGQTPLQFAISRKRYDTLDLLIMLGADTEASDRSGQTALESAMLHADREAISRLLAAGARPPRQITQSRFNASMKKVHASIKKGVPAINVPDIAAALDWYKSIGFKELGRFEDDGIVNWGMVSFGKAEVMFGMGGANGTHDVSLWFYTDQIDQLYELIKSRQIGAALAAMTGNEVSNGVIEFVEDINDPFYGGREFGIRDLNGYNLFFHQPSRTKS